MLKKAQGAIVSTTVGVYSLASNQAKRRLLRVSSSISAKVISYESLISHDHEAAVAVIESLQEINIYQRLIVPLRMERVRVFNLESDELLFPRKTTGMRVFHMTAEGSDISKFINLFQSLHDEQPGMVCYNYKFQVKGYDRLGECDYIFECYALIPTIGVETGWFQKALKSLEELTGFQVEARDIT